MMRKTANCLVLLMLLMTASALSGCNVLAWAASPLRDIEHKRSVQAQYSGLHNQRVGVLISADEHTLLRYPLAQQKLSQALARSFVSELENVQVIKPEQVLQFQQRNPYWITLPYSTLLEQLNVDRLVFIDIVEYRTNEPGNSQVWRGDLVANVSVAEADAQDPNRLVYATTVQSMFPPDRPMGVLDSDQDTVELGMILEFARKVTNLFHDHQVVTKG